MSIDWNALATAALGAVATWIVGILLTWLTAAGRKLREQGVSPRSTLYVAITALGLSVGALIASLFLQHHSNGVIAGSWNGNTLDRVTPGAKLKSSRAQNLIRISFEAYNFNSPPIVMCDAPWNVGARAYVANVTKDFVDIVPQQVVNGALNGGYAGNAPFMFEIIPTE